MAQIDRPSPLPNEWLRKYFTAESGNRPGSTELIAVAKNIQTNLEVINPQLAGPAIEALLRLRNGALSRREKGLSVVEKFLSQTIGTVTAKLGKNMDSPEAIIMSGMGVARELDHTGSSAIFQDSERFRANLIASRLRASTMILGKQVLESEERVWIMEGFTKPASVWPTDKRNLAISVYLEEKYMQALNLLTVPPQKSGHLPIATVYDKRVKSR